MLTLPLKSLVLALGFTPDGALRVAEAGGVLTHVDVSSGKATASLRFKKAEMPKASFSRDGRRLAYGGEKRLVIVDAANGDMLVEHKVPPKQCVASVQWTRDGRLLAVLRAALAGGVGCVVLFDGSGRELERLPLPNFPCNGKAALCGDIVHVDADGHGLHAFSLKDRSALPSSVALAPPRELVESSKGTLVLTSEEVLLFQGALGKPKRVPSITGRACLGASSAGADLFVVFSGDTLANKVVVFGLDGKTRAKVDVPEMSYSCIAASADTIALARLREVSLLPIST
jgi:hypothetical protein